MHVSRVDADQTGGHVAPYVQAGDVIDQLRAIERGTGVLAVLVHVEGGFYRSVGAMMFIGLDGACIGALSAGCIDHDIALNAQEVAHSGHMKRLRYGVGSEFLDLTLPCGGAIEIELWPAARLTGVSDTLSQMAAREVACFTLPSGVEFKVIPDLRIALYGEGEDAATFAAVARAAGYEVCDDLDTAQMAERVDGFTALVVMIHDHQKEDAILGEALKSPAFWIGALGSARAHTQRLARLQAVGVSAPALNRIHGPIGLIPARREPRGLAVSILADVVASYSCM